MFKCLAAAGMAAMVTLSTSLPGLAQDYPNKEPIKIVVPVAAGGLTDAVARITAEFLQPRLGQAVVVENRPGAGSTIGTAFVANADPDGYTLLFVGAEQAVSPAVMPELPYSYTDMTFLIRPFIFQPLVLARPDFPADTMQDVVDYMRENPGRLRYGTTGVGAIVHMGSAMIEGAIGAKGVHVPYAGIAPAYADLLAGNIDITFGGSVPFIDGLKVIGSVGTERHPAYPDLLTLEEAGIEGASWLSWFGFLAPEGLPDPIAERLISEITAVIEDPAAIEQYRAATQAVPDAEPLTGAAYKEEALKLVETWKAVAAREGIVIQQ